MYIRSTSFRASRPSRGKSLPRPASNAKRNFLQTAKKFSISNRAASKPSPWIPGKRRALNITAELDVDFAKEKMEVFHQAWSYLHDNFFDEKMNGVDWNAEHAKYAPYIEGSSTPDEMRRVISLMIGDLNSSHSGIAAGGGAGGPGGRSGTGRIGLSFDPAEYDRTGHLRITEIIPLGPASLVKGIKVGDYLVVRRRRKYWPAHQSG